MKATMVLLFDFTNIVYIFLEIPVFTHKGTNYDTLKVIT